MFVQSSSGSQYVFPAYAGMDRLGDGWLAVPGRVPRLRGDGPFGMNGMLTRIECSPPTRGWTDAPASPHVHAFVFPAYAGMDRRSGQPARTRLRVPRLRGDGPVISSPDPERHGCSPPTRGWTGRPG